MKDLVCQLDLHQNLNLPYFTHKGTLRFLCCRQEGRPRNLNEDGISRVNTEQCNQMRSKKYQNIPKIVQN
jgi:hypothetical protein